MWEKKRRASDGIAQYQKQRSSTSLWLSNLTTGTCDDAFVAGYSPHNVKKVAFFVGLTENFGPVTEHTDIVFDRVITNIGGGYEQKTGRFTAPYDAVYQFNVIVSAQGRQKVSTNVLYNYKYKYN